MTRPRLCLRSCVTITTLDARTYAPTHPCVVDLISTDGPSSQASPHAVVSCPQPVIEPTGGTAQPPLAARFEPHQALQSP